jgi:hypothetical protein
MKEKKRMPERLPTDGPITVGRIPDSDPEVFYIEVHDKDDNIVSCVEMSGFNAWRVLGCLSVVLELPLAPSTSKAIKMGDKPTIVTIGPREPLNSLGDRVAFYLQAKELAKQTGGEFEYIPPKPKKGRK